MKTRVRRKRWARRWRREVEERAKDTADTEREDWTAEGREIEERVERGDAESNESLRQFFQRGARALEFLVTSFFFLSNFSN